MVQVCGCGMTTTTPIGGIRSARSSGVPPEQPERQTSELRDAQVCLAPALLPVMDVRDASDLAERRRECAGPHQSDGGPGQS